MFDDSESESGSSAFSGAVFFNSVEAFEDAIEQRFGDAFAGVLDGDHDGVELLLEQKRYRAVPGSVFEGVIEEIGEDRLECLGIGVKGELRWSFEVELDVLSVGDGFEGAEHFGGDSGGIEGLEVKDFLSGFDAGELQHFEDELEKSLGLFFDLFEEVSGGIVVFEGTGKECIGAGLDDGEGCFEFVRDATDEIASHGFESADIGDIANNDDGAWVWSFLNGDNGQKVVRVISGGAVFE